VLALGFLAGTTDAVVPVAFAALPIVILLGLLNFLRLVDISIEDVGALRAINRIPATTPVSYRTRRSTSRHPGTNR
jgi:hypothetical protein